MLQPTRVNCNGFDNLMSYPEKKKIDLILAR